MSAGDRPGLREGCLYTREEIHRLLGGDLQSYLPHVGGRVVCGCFRVDLNPDAPGKVLVGDSEDVVKYAKVLAQQGEPTPVFIKREPKRWEYIGDFLAVEYCEDPEEVAQRAADAGRNELAGVLVLEPVDKTQA